MGDLKVSGVLHLRSNVPAVYVDPNPQEEQQQGRNQTQQKQSKKPAGKAASRKCPTLDSTWTQQRGAWTSVP